MSNPREREAPRDSQTATAESLAIVEALALVPVCQGFDKREERRQLVTNRKNNRVCS